MGSDIGLGFAASNLISEHRIICVTNICVADAASSLLSCSGHSRQSLRPEAVGTVLKHLGSELQCSSPEITETSCRLIFFSASLH